MKLYQPIIAVALVLATTIGPVFALPRADVGLDNQWKFIRQDVAGAEAVGFDDSTWQTVDLPHTWNNMDGQDGGNDYYRGVGWYRRHLKVNSRYAGKSLFLKFDGAATVADVFVNGRPAGAHRGNFGAFCFDVTPLLRVGQDNVIAVKVNNARDPDIAPLDGDFTVFGGLYRDAHLLVLDKLSISPLDYASPGVYIRQNRVTPDLAELEITTKLRNANDAAKKATVRCTITDAGGKRVAGTGSQQEVPANGSRNAVQTIKLPKPHLWNGRSDPYLYQVSVEVQDGRKLVDSVTQPLGVRFFRADPDKGFFLNGQHVALHGVNRHQDRIDKGWAIGPAEHEEDFNLIMEMGCTAIRLAHYQHAQYFYDLCDRGGLVVWAELSLVNKLGESPAFAENARQQLTELIKQNYNHPSIIFWSLFNELRFRDKLPEAAECELISDLNKLAKTLDPTRLTVAASCCVPATHPSTGITDIIGLNWYYGWYSGQPEDWPGKLDELHQTLPARCVGITEYGAGASIVQHEIPPRQPKPVSPWHPEEWQCVVHEAAWKAMKDRPWLWGTFLWNMFDFAADQRKEGDHLGRNDKGLVTYDRKVKKDTFFWYKANWTTDPFVYITSRRFTIRTEPKTPVKIYSNCNEVKLNVNGVSLGPVRSGNHIFLWKEVTLKPGANRIEAVGLKRGRSFTDSCVWTWQSAEQMR
jgi:beta-galactosidase